MPGPIAEAYILIDSTWTQASEAYVLINGSWVQVQITEVQLKVNNSWTTV